MGQSLQMSAVLFGTSLQFSDQLIRVLAIEFPDVRFDRQHDTALLPGLSPEPRLVVIHETVPDLEKSIDQVRAQLPDVTVAVACTDLSEFRRVLGSETARSVGFLPLNASIDVWLSILRLLLCGHAYVPAEVFCGTRESLSPRSESPARNGAGDKVCLTPREMEILPYIAQGLQNKVIAGNLGLSDHTVKLHTHNIFAKLGVSNRTAAAQWYLSRMKGEARAEEIHDL